MAGRGYGKTRLGAEATSHYLHGHPGSRVALVAPTWRDARDTMVEGESGLLRCLPPDAVRKWNASLGELQLANGSQAACFAATQPDRLRGPQHAFAWGDEVAAWERPETWDQLLLGLRLGERPQVVLTTTPRPRRLVRTILDHPKTVTVRGSTYDNLDNLAPDFAERVLAIYRGSRLERQEIFGELIEDVEGALWRQGPLDDGRVAEAPADLVRSVVGVDPAGGGRDETGIVVAARGADGQGYVLADRSGQYHPETWARRAIAAYHEYRCDLIVAEKNYGGEMVQHTIATVDASVPVRLVQATRGKAIRAEPIATAYAQGLVHHAGEFPALEKQMCEWTQDSGESPDRLDALVWAMTEVLDHSAASSFLHALEDSRVPAAS
ncbi:MAG TPA: terminase family protein [Verrucomicrobiae bacterium]|nr:terminase family protein [Verrucomicrobiae bacterium]